MVHFKLISMCGARDELKALFHLIFSQSWPFILASFVENTIISQLITLNFWLKIN